MRKIILTALLAVVAAGAVSARQVMINGKERDEQEWKRRGLANRGYTNISFVTQTMTMTMTTPIIQGDIELGKSDWGAAISRGRTFVMHPRPVAGMLFFGLDATWVDLNYAQYGKSILGMDITDLTGGYKLHQADVSVGIGPSVHITPVGKLGVHTYFRYHPTYGAYANDDFDFVMAGYVSAFTAGAAVSWGLISLGAEARWGTGTYALKRGELDGLDIGPKLKTSGLRTYLSFRF